MESVVQEANVDIIKKFGKNEKDSGASEVQIALFTNRIAYLSEHMKANPKDFHSRFGLVRLVNKRKKLLSYLKRKNPDAYQKLIASLGLRK